MENGIDWDTFAARVPENTKVYVAEFDLDGILLESFPYYAFERNIQWRANWKELPEGDNLENPNYLRYQSLDTRILGYGVCDATEMNYFINGTWLTFEQVMA